MSAVTNQPVPALEAEFAGQGYGTLKNAVAEAVVAFAEPFGKRMAELMSDPAEIDRILARGAERAGPVAARTVQEVYERVGFVPPAIHV